MGEREGSDLYWLLLGAAVGLVAVGYGLLQVDDAAGTLPDTALARVNENLIGRDEFERALARLAPVDPSAEDKVWLLQRLVDDELLVQRGIELGIPESDTAVRSAIVNSIVASVTAEADAADPTDAELREYLTANTEKFSYTARLAVDAWQTDDEAVAQAFVTALRNGREEDGGPDIEPLPGLQRDMVPIEELRDHVGPGIAAAAADMPDGMSAVFARRGRWLVVRVRQKETRSVTDLSSIRNRVLLDYRRNRADETLAEYVDGLRQRADVVVTQP